MNYFKNKKVFMIGIKGVGMTALALVIQDMGGKVSGTDVAEEFITDKILKERKIPVAGGFGKLPENIDAVIFTAAHQGSGNPLVIKAKEREIDCFSYAQALAKTVQGKRVIAVAGSHGKTTTTAMLAKILLDVGFKPSWLVGTSEIPDLQVPGRFDKTGKFFVVEADEYFEDIGPASKPKFLFLNPFGVIITMVDWDHPDVFPSEKHYFNAFKKLIKRIPKKGFLATLKTPTTIRLAKSVKIPQKIIDPEIFFPQIKIKLPGRHFLADAKLAAAMAKRLGVKSQAIIKSLADYQGAKRRFELVCRKNDIEVFDDYSHHPVEIKETIIAAKNKYKRIFVIFESHTFSRTKEFVDDFARSLALADFMLLAPIFASAREQKSDFTDKEFYARVSQKALNTIAVNSPEKALEFIKKNIRPGDAIITMGAGKVYLWAKEICKNL